MLTFDLIEDSPRLLRRGKRARYFEADNATQAILVARRVLMADPRHNPVLAEHLLAATQFIQPLNRAARAIRP